MNNFIPASLKLTALISFVICCAFTFTNNTNDRNIELAGLVVDANSLLPLDSATISDSENHVLGYSDKNGYYKVALHFLKLGPINFKLKVTKSGFQAFTQHENWGDVSNNYKAVIYFGLKGSGTAKPFSSLSAYGNSIAYPNVLNGFSTVKTKAAFDRKLDLAKAGNEHVFVRIDSNYYITNNTGWIQLHSDRDSVSINNKQVLAANKLNDAVKRKDVKWMTPIATKNAKFGIYTKSAK